MKEIDITNRIVKICRRITDIEHALACNDQSESKTIMLNEELDNLNNELDYYETTINKTMP